MFKAVDIGADFTGRSKEPMRNFDEGFWGKFWAPNPSIISDRSLSKLVIHLCTWVSALVVAIIFHSDINKDFSGDAAKDVHLPERFRALSLLALILMIVAIGGILVVGSSFRYPALHPLINSVLGTCALISLGLYVSFVDRLDGWDGSSLADADGTAYPIDLSWQYRYSVAIASLLAFGLSQVVSYVVYSLAVKHMDAQEDAAKTNP